MEPRRVCDQCEDEKIEPPGDVAEEYDITINDRHRHIELCSVHDRAFMPFFVMVCASPDSKHLDQSEDFETGETSAQAAPVYFKPPLPDSTTTPAAIEPPRTVPEPRHETPPALPAEEAQQALPPVERTPKHGWVVCVACREAGHPVDKYRMPYKYRRDHAMREPHNTAMSKLVWEGEQLRFPCTNPDHEACRQTGFSFPEALLAATHSNTERANSLRAARAQRQAILQAELRKSGVPLVVCPMTHDFEGPYAIALNNRSAHARFHSLHMGDIDWIEDGTPLPFVCASTTSAHKKCTGRLRFPTELSLFNHQGFANRGTQADTLQFAG